MRFLDMRRKVLGSEYKIFALLLLQHCNEHLNLGLYLAVAYRYLVPNVTVRILHSQRTLSVLLSCSTP